MKNAGHLYKIPMLYFQSIALTRIRIRYVHRRRTILHSTILIYALKEVIYVLTLKVTQLWNVSFSSDSVKSGRSDAIFDEYLGRRWFEVYQCGTSYCAINYKKKTNKRQTKKPFDAWQTSGKFRENVWENVYISNRVVYLCLRVYNYKRKMNHRSWSTVSVHDLNAYHTWLHFLTYEKNSISNFSFWTIFLNLKK